MMSGQGPRTRHGAYLEGFTIQGEGLRLHVLSMAAATPESVLGLTRAEGEVASALLRGLSHREIAFLRGTRPRTVANQVQAIFRKAGVCSREEFACALLAFGSGPGEPRP